MKVDNLLSRLKKVKVTGKDQWVACCPAHDDKRPSLAIRETHDGLVLLHCFAGCDPLSVLQAVGLSFEDVMPEKLGEHKPLKRKFNPHTVAEVTAFNASVIALIADQVAAGNPLTAQDAAKLQDMAAEIREAVAYGLA